MHAGIASQCNSATGHLPQNNALRTRLTAATCRTWITFNQLIVIDISSRRGFKIGFLVVDSIRAPQRPDEQSPLVILDFIYPSFLSWS
jgi:hypothetical protein